jgi:hypothetical protein
LLTVVWTLLPFCLALLASALLINTVFEPGLAGAVVILPVLPQLVQHHHSYIITIVIACPCHPIAVN